MNSQVQQLWQQEQQQQLEGPVSVYFRIHHGNSFSLTSEFCSTCTAKQGTRSYELLPKQSIFSPNPNFLIWQFAFDDN
jgi:hypothetical protein